MDQFQEPSSSRLVSIYQNHKRFIWSTLITIALAVAATVVYLLFFRHDEPQFVYRGDAALEINAPAESTSGGELSYEIVYENSSNDKLTEIALEMFYPRGFSFEGSTPDPGTDGGRKFTLADLEPGKKQRVVVVGKLEGDLQEVKTVSAKLHYVPQNFRSNFTTEAQAETVMLAPELTLRILAPVQVSSGQLAEYEVEIRNVSGRDFSNLLLTLTFPEGFAFMNSSITPKANSSQRQWEIVMLATGASANLKIRGKLSLTAEVAQSESFIQGELTQIVRDEQRTIGRSYAFTTVTEPPLRVSHSLRDGQGALAPGAELDYIVAYENRGQVALENVTLIFNFETAVFDFSEVSGDEGQIRPRCRNCDQCGRGRAGSSNFGSN